jgi:hypothetical protein
VKTVVSFSGFIKHLVSERLLAFQEGFFCMQFRVYFKHSSILDDWCN